MAQPPPTGGLDLPQSPYAHQKSNPRLRKLAKQPLKPLKLAASAYHSVRSGRATPNSAHSVAGLESDMLSMGISGGSTSWISRSGTSTSASSNSTLDPQMSINERNWRGRAKDSILVDPVLIAQAAKGPRKPLEGEEPAAWVRVRVVSADSLVAKDRNGLSDP